MIKVYEVDYHGKCHLLGKVETVKEAVALEKKALKKSHGEYPTFSSDGKKQITNNGEIL